MPESENKGINVVLHGVSADGEEVEVCIVCAYSLLRFVPPDCVLELVPRGWAEFLSGGKTIDIPEKRILRVQGDPVICDSSKTEEGIGAFICQVP